MSPRPAQRHTSQGKQPETLSCKLSRWQSATSMWPCKAHAADSGHLQWLRKHLRHVFAGTLTPGVHKET